MKIKRLWARDACQIKFISQELCWLNGFDAFRAINVSKIETIINDLKADSHLDFTDHIKTLETLLNVIRDYGEQDID